MKTEDKLNERLFLLRKEIKGSISKSKKQLKDYKLPRNIKGYWNGVIDTLEEINNLLDKFFPEQKEKVKRE